MMSRSVDPYGGLKGGAEVAGSVQKRPALDGIKVVEFAHVIAGRWPGR